MLIQRKRMSMLYLELKFTLPLVNNYKHLRLISNGFDNVLFFFSILKYIPNCCKTSFVNEYIISRKI